MKKTSRILFALIALLGILNCAVMEPAFAMHHETETSSEDDTDCCFVHCSLLHQFIHSGFTFVNPVSYSNSFAPLDALVEIDPPFGSIFHPPLAV